MAKSIYVQGMHAGQPIPAAAVVGNILMSGGITGLDPETGTTPESIEEQCEQLFKNIRAIMEQAGGTPDDIVKVTVFLKPGENREAVNVEWAKMYPDEASRPARHALQHTGLGGATLIQCDITAVLQS